MADEEEKDSKNTTASVSDALLIFGTVADTTWRLFLPTLGGTVLGIWGDHSFETKPWLLIAGVTCGTILSLYLVFRQLQGVKTK